LSVVCFTTGARAGNARAPGALERLLKSKDWPVACASAEQVHGARVQVVGKLDRSRRFAGADGLVTEAVDQPLAIFTADCVPVFLSGPRVAGILHAGWRGVRAGILPRALRLLARQRGMKASGLCAWAGPSIRPCCFEVGWDVARHFPATRKRRGTQWTVDLEGELRRQTRRLGVRWLEKKAFEGCTMHELRFFSYRRNQTDERQVSVIMRRS